MKSIASAFAFCFLFLSVGVAQLSPVPSLQPTPLEAFAHQPATHVAWSKQVGSLDSSEAADARARLQDLMKQGAQKIVLDLRSVAGGEIQEGVTVANFFIRDGQIAKTIGREQKVQLRIQRCGVPRRRNAWRVQKCAG